MIPPSAPPLVSVMVSPETILCFSHTYITPVRSPDTWENFSGTREKMPVFNPAHHLMARAGREKSGYIMLF
jgi:hypothetical protein